MITMHLKDDIAPLKSKTKFSASSCSTLEWPQDGGNVEESGEKVIFRRKKFNERSSSFSSAIITSTYLSKQNIETGMLKKICITE